jgi:DNA-binding transcriptional regulator YhcF (GntR family)
VPKRGDIMRYTRYEYKKSSKIKFLCSVAVIVGISIGGGLYISNFIFDGRNVQNNGTNSLNYSTEGNYEDKVKNIIALQCGYYSKEENAKESLASISKYCQPLIVEDDGKYRVLAGIYNEEDGLKKMEEFKANNIDVAKVSLNISDNTIENEELVEIIDGFLTIINKLQDNGVKSIKTEEFKTWTEKIVNEGNNVKSTKINELSSYVKSLPDEIDKTNSNASIQELYKLIKN